MYRKRISVFAQTLEIEENQILFFNSIFRKPLVWDRNKYEKLLSETLNSEEISELEKIHFFMSELEEEKLIGNVQKFYAENFKCIDTIYINITNNCNLSCNYCLVGKYRKKSTLSIANFKEFYKQILTYIEENTQEIRFILYGGEPFLEKEKLRYVINELSKLKNCTIGIITNGTLVDVDFIKYLGEKDVYLNVSVDGPLFITDSHRKFKNCLKSVYKTVEKNIQILSNYILEDRIALSITITPEVLENQDELIKWLIKTNVKKVVYNILRRTSITTKYKDYYYKVAELMEKTYNQLKQYGISEGITEQILYYFKKSGIRMTSCAAMAGTEVTLDCDGKLYCCHGCYSVDSFLGDATIELRSIEKRRMIDKLPIFREECKQCKAFAICGGKCYYEDEENEYCVFMNAMVEWVAKKLWLK